jgi:hypothetical protein
MTEHEKPASRNSARAKAVRAGMATTWHTRGPRCDFALKRDPDKHHRNTLTLKQERSTGGGPIGASRIPLLGELLFYKRAFSGQRETCVLMTEDSFIPARFGQSTFMDRDGPLTETARPCWKLHIGATSTRLRDHWLGRRRFYVASRNAQPSPMAHLTARGQTSFCVRPRRLKPGSISATSRAGIFRRRRAHVTGFGVPEHHGSAAISAPISG